MKKIIHGKMYNTETAQEVGMDSFSHSEDFNFWKEANNMELEITRNRPADKSYVHIQLTRETIKKIGIIATELDISKTAVMRKFIEYGINNINLKLKGEE